MVVVWWWWWFGGGGGSLVVVVVVVVVVVWWWWWWSEATRTKSITFSRLHVLIANTSHLIKTTHAKIGHF